MKRFAMAGAVLAAGLMASQAMAADAVRSAPVAPLAPLVSAPAGIQGYVGLGGAMLNLEGESPHAVAFGGALNVPVGGLNVEFEGAGAAIWIPNDPSTGYGRGAAHVFYRTPGMALGGFVGFDSGSEFFGPPISNWIFGGEAQAYLGHLNLYGQVGDMSAVNIGSLNTWFVRGEAQLFLTDNIVVSGDVRFINDFEGSGLSVTTWGGTAEARFAGTPWSVFGTYRVSTFASGGPTNVTTGLVGIRINVGNGSERQQYTTGASMNLLPSF
jgi:hypothetical protein